MNEEKVTAYTLNKLYEEAFQNTFNVKPQKWTIKNSVLLKKLIEEQGEEFSKNLVLSTLENWQEIKSKLKGVYGLPTIGFIYAFRFPILDILNTTRNNSVEYKSNETKKQKRIVTLRKKKFTNLSAKELFLRG